MGWDLPETVACAKCGRELGIDDEWAHPTDDDLALCRECYQDVHRVPEAPEQREARRARHYDVLGWGPIEITVRD